MSDGVIWRTVAIAATVMLAACTQGQPTAENASGVPVDAPTFVGRLSTEFRAAVPNVVNFGFDSDVLDKTGIANVKAQAAWIIQHPEVQFSVTGHTDKVGNIEYNQELGLRRANRVVAALIELGVSEEQLIAMVSFGEENPLVDTEQRERLNRRTVTEVLGLLEVGTINPSVPDPFREDDDDDNPPPPPPPPPTPGTDPAGNPLSPIDPGPTVVVVPNDA